MKHLNLHDRREIAWSARMNGMHPAWIEAFDATDSVARKPLVSLAGIQSSKGKNHQDA